MAWLHDQRFSWVDSWCRWRHSLPLQNIKCCFLTITPRLQTLFYCPESCPTAQKCVNLCCAYLWSSFSIMQCWSEWNRPLCHIINQSTSTQAVSLITEWLVWETIPARQQHFFLSQHSSVLTFLAWSRPGFIDDNTILEPQHPVASPPTIIMRSSSMVSFLFTDPDNLTSCLTHNSYWSHPVL